MNKCFNKVLQCKRTKIEPRVHNTLCSLDDKKYIFVCSLQSMTSKMVALNRQPVVLCMEVHGSLVYRAYM